MAGTSISCGNAKKYANYARMGGVVLLVAATGLWALNIPGMQELPQKPAPAPTPEAQPKTDASQQTARLDAMQVTDAAERLEIAWVKAPKAAEPETPLDPVPDPPAAGPEWTYLGPIKEAHRCLAMVSVEGSQRILAVGRQLGDTKLVEADDEKITLETNGARREVRKSARSGPTVAWLRTMPGNAPMANSGAVMPGQAGMSPEVLQRLRERGIDPAQAQRFREQQQGRNRGQPGNGNGNRPGGGGNAAGLNFGGVNAAVPTARGQQQQRTTSDDAAIRAETAN